MAAVQTYQARPVRVQALQIVLGDTTRTEILALCPAANVGVLCADGKDDEKDIRWVVVPGGEMTADGDWLVAFPDGTFDIIADDQFRAAYEISAGRKTD